MSSPQLAASSLQQLTIDRRGQHRRRRPRVWAWAAVLLVLISGITAFLFAQTEPVQLSTVVTVYPSQRYALLATNGYVVAQRRAAVASKASGRLMLLNVREGSIVKQGDLLARLDAGDALAAIAQSQATIRQAEAGVQQAKVESENVRMEFERASTLRAQGFMSQQALDLITNRMKTTSAALAFALSTVEVAQTQRAIQQVGLAYTDIRAPFDGVVLVKNANVGDLITPFSNAVGSQGAVLTMADLRTLEVEVDVAETNIGLVQRGQAVEVALDSLLGQRFRGSVSSIVPTVDRAKATVTAKIRFETLDPRILPEMSARVTLLSQAISDADLQPVMALDPSAVAMRDGNQLVFRVKGDGVELVPVRLGRKIGEHIEVSGALAPGERLVKSPSAKMDARTKLGLSGLEQ